MDAFNVPKKVNRHVLKAINALNDGKLKKAIPLMEILNEVKYQMRNLVPVQNLDMVVQESLKNVCSLGLVERTGPKRYAVGRHYAAASENPSSSSRDAKINRERSRKRSAESNLNNESSGTSKRVRKNKQINRSANAAKIRQPKPRHVAYALDTPLFPTDIFGGGYLLDILSNRHAVIYDFVHDLEWMNNLNMESIDIVPTSVEIREIPNDSILNSSNPLQTAGETSKKAEVQLIELYRNSKSISNSATSTQTAQKEDETTLKSENKLTDLHHNSRSETLQKSESQLIELHHNSKSNNSLTNPSNETQWDTTLNNSAKPSGEAVNSFCGTAENLSCKF